MVMKLQAFCLLMILLPGIMLGTSRPSQAQENALEELVGIFEKKGVLTSAEVKLIRDIMAEDKNRLLKKEKEIEDRKKALVSREKELQEKEDALKRRAYSLYEAEKTSPAQAPRTEKLPEKIQKGLPVEAYYDEGLRFSTFDRDLFSLYIGGLLQTDYRYYDYDKADPANNRFDLRRVRLIVGGHFSRYFDYKFEYEFQGLVTRRILDAYIDARAFPFASFRVGQFKEPFSLQQYTQDKNNVFAERSMGFYLMPQRDVGLMVHASVWDDRINYGLGIFNGDGGDDATGGNVDDPEWTGRLVFSPFKNRGLSLWENFQVGGSFGYARIDRNNVTLDVKTAGLTSFFKVSSSAKFNVIRDADKRYRYGAELGWAAGPVALAGEYIRVEFKDVTTSSSQFSFNLEDYYIAFLWMITGEKPTFKKGVFQDIKPIKNAGRCGWGGLGLAFRYDFFSADDSVYENLIEQGDSVREAEAYTIALNWYLNPFVRLILDATRTTFDSPLVVSRDPLTASSIFSDRESVFTGRFQFAF
jgi:phosphate-selective porin OprO/OprP